jgi:GTP-binding protein
VVTKIETVESKQVDKVRKALEKASSQKVYAISAQAHRGLDEVLYAALQLVQEARLQRAAEEAARPAVVINETSFPDMWKLVPEEDGFRVTGERLEGFARRTDWQSRDGLERMRDIMRKMGVGKQLEKLGAEPGTIVRIGEYELEWL